MAPIKTPAPSAARASRSALRAEAGQVTALTAGSGSALRLMMAGSLKLYRISL
jgi:hypothetical protein